MTFFNLEREPDGFYKLYVGDLVCVNTGWTSWPSQASAVLSGLDNSAIARRTTFLVLEVEHIRSEFEMPYWHCHDLPVCKILVKNQIRYIVPLVSGAYASLVNRKKEMIVLQRRPPKKGNTE